MPAKEALLDVAKRLNLSGLNQGTAGNVSVRDGDGFWVTPSGVGYDAMTAEDLVRVAWDGSWASERKGYVPTSEWRFHRDILQARPNLSSIVHVHPPFATALACLRRDIPPFHYMVAVAGGTSIKCSTYATFGTQELSDAVLEALGPRRACLIANHGMVACDATPQKALALAIEVEALAAQYIRTLQVGEPAILDEDEMQLILEKFAAGYSGRPNEDDE